MDVRYMCRRIQNFLSFESYPQLGVGESLFELV